MPILIIINALVFAVLLCAVVVPPLYIYDPERDVSVSLHPPVSHGVLSDYSISPSTKQKLYILFVVPACAFLNALFLYVTYYRHMRSVLLRAELALVAAFNLTVLVDALIREGLIEEWNLSRQADLLSTHPEGGEHVAVNNYHFTLNKRVRRHIGTESVSIGHYSTSPWMPDVRKLQQAVECNFLNISESVRRETLNALNRRVVCRIEEKGDYPSQNLLNTVENLVEHHKRVLSDIEAKIFIHPALTSMITNNPV